MTDPKNSEDQELSMDQLKDAAGGAAFMKLGDTKGEYRQVIHPEFRDRISSNAPRLELRTSPKENLGGTAGPGGSTF